MKGWVILSAIKIDSRAVGDSIFHAKPPIEAASGLLALGTGFFFFTFKLKPRLQLEILRYISFQHHNSCGGPFFNPYTAMGDCRPKLTKRSLLWATIVAD